MKHSAHFYKDVIKKLHFECKIQDKDDIIARYENKLKDAE
jgi:hypothetical protein